MAVHQPGDRADGRRRRREGAALREHLARVEDRRQPGGADDRNPGLEQVAARCLVTRRMPVMRTTEVDRTGHARPPATIGQFPTQNVG
jgi:hypothetical protein